MRTAKILLLILAPTILCGAIASNSGRLAKRVADLEAQVAEMQEILQYVHVKEGNIRGVTGPHWIFEGVNIHVRSGYGSTIEDCGVGAPDFPNCESLTGLGNLIIGYNEEILIGSPQPFEVRTGSHNLVVGEFHTFSSVAGLVAGEFNRVTGSHASITGGRNNEASGRLSSVSGGDRNKASGRAATVSGGQLRNAPDDFNWAAGSLLESN